MVKYSLSVFSTVWKHIDMLTGYVSRIGINHGTEATNFCFEPVDLVESRLGQRPE